MTGAREQARISAALGVAERFEAAADLGRRIDFLAGYLENSGATGYVLGISGGIDSAVAGRLGQLACERAGRTMTAVRLPYGVQFDEAAAQMSLGFVGAPSVVTVDIRPSVDALVAAVALGGVEASDRGAADYVKGNVKARQRMVIQYAIAASCGALVIGTDHAAEAVMGFFTKFGDGACDVAPLSGLTKRRVRALALELGAPDALIHKTPTADLEDDRPGLPDETAYGISYDVIDDYLEGLPVDDSAQRLIQAAFAATAHKRALPVTP